MSFTISPPRRRKIQISLTPLVDIVFTLLIFFMLATSLQQIRSVDLVPPGDGEPPALPNPQLTRLILVEGQDRYALDGRIYDLERLGALLATQTDRPTFIQSGSEAVLQDILSLIDLTRTLSLSDVSLVGPATTE